jgi:hypothetical protein
MYAKQQTPTSQFQSPATVSWSKGIFAQAPFGKIGKQQKLNSNHV